MEIKDIKSDYPSPKFVTSEHKKTPPKVCKFEQWVKQMNFGNIVIMMSKFGSKSGDLSSWRWGYYKNGTS